MEHRVVAFGFIRESAMRNTEDTNHYGYPKDRRAAFGNLKAKEKFRVEKSRQSQDASKRTADKGHEAAKLVGLVFGELLEIVDCEWVGLTYARLE